MKLTSGFRLVSGLVLASIAFFGGHECNGYADVRNFLNNIMVTVRGPSGDLGRGFMTSNQTALIYNKATQLPNDVQAELGSGMKLEVQRVMLSQITEWHKLIFKRPYSSSEVNYLVKAEDTHPHPTLRTAMAVSLFGERGNKQKCTPGIDTYEVELLERVEPKLHWNLQKVKKPFDFYNCRLSNGSFLIAPTTNQYGVETFKLLGLYRIGYGYDYVKDDLNPITKYPIPKDTDFYVVVPQGVWHY